MALQTAVPDRKPTFNPARWACTTPGRSTPTCRPPAGRAGPGPRRGRADRQRRPGRLHRRTHRPLAEGQVHRREPVDATRSGGARSTSRSTGRLRPPAGASAPTCRAASCSSSTAAPAPTRPTPCRSRRRREGLAQPCSPAACSCGRRRPSWPAFAPELDDPARRRLPRRPGRRRHPQSEAFVVLNFDAAARADRRHALRRRDQEGGLHRTSTTCCRSSGVFPMHCSANVGAGGRHGACSSACRAPARRRCRPTPSGG